MICLVYVLKYLPFGLNYKSIKELVTKVTTSISNRCKKCTKKKEDKDPDDFETSEVYQEKGGGKMAFTKRFSLLLGVGTTAAVVGEESKDERTINPLHRESQSSKCEDSNNSNKKRKKLRLKKKFNRAVDKAKEQINKIKIPKFKLPSMSRVMLKVTTGI